MAYSCGHAWLFAQRDPPSHRPPLYPMLHNYDHQRLAVRLVLHVKPCVESLTPISCDAVLIELTSDISILSFRPP